MKLKKLAQMLSDKEYDRFLEDRGDTYSPIEPERQRHTYKGKTWFVESLLKHAENIPVTEYPISDIRCIKHKLPVLHKPVTVVELAYHDTVSKKANMDYPIIVGENGRIMDGWHRLQKALVEGRKTILTKKFDVDPEPDRYEDVIGSNEAFSLGNHLSIKKQREDWFTGTVVTYECRYFYDNLTDEEKKSPNKHPSKSLHNVIFKEYLDKDKVIFRCLEDFIKVKKNNNSYIVKLKDKNSTYKKKYPKYIRITTYTLKENVDFKLPRNPDSFKNGNAHIKLLHEVKPSNIEIMKFEDLLKKYDSNYKSRSHDNKELDKRKSIIKELIDIITKILNKPEYKNIKKYPDRFIFDKNIDNKILNGDESELRCLSYDIYRSDGDNQEIMDAIDLFVDEFADEIRKSVKHLPIKVDVDGDWDAGDIIFEIKDELNYASEGFLDFFNVTVTEYNNQVKITSFPILWFLRKIKRKYGTHKVCNFIKAESSMFRGKCTVTLYNFFLPELLKMMGENTYTKDIQSLIFQNTWAKSFITEQSDIPNRVDFNKIKTNMVNSLKLLPHQEEYINQYDYTKYRAQLNGSLLSLDCGLGKTLTSLATMEAIGIEKVVILAPKSTLIKVWVDHVEKFFNKKDDFYVVGDNPKDCKYYIFNYEAIDKIYEVMDYIKKVPSSKIGLIVDESHNFLRMNSSRTQNLIKLREDLGTSDAILMSGTPVKAVGAEIAPILATIDPHFNKEASEKFFKAFGKNTPSMANDIINARLGLFMFRRMKEDVVALPVKNETDLQVVCKNGDRYTIDNVKKLLVTKQDELKKYHDTQKHIYEEEWNECMTYIETQTSISKMNEYKRYHDIVKYLRKNGFYRGDERLVKEVVWMNQWEKSVLRPAMTRELIRKFDHCRAAYKYIDMKIQGEILGYLGKLRGEMTSELLQATDLSSLIDSAIKKTIFFTSFVDVLNVANEELIKRKYKPCLIYGGTKNVPAEIDKFIKEPDLNPLVCTIQTLATGVTLTVASKSIFINRPWRQADYQQASDRIYRIGQDVDVDIITLTLDTGDEPNLSTRMQDILSWSKTSTDAIVDGIQYGSENLKSDIDLNYIFDLDEYFYK